MASSSEPPVVAAMFHQQALSFRENLYAALAHASHFSNAYVGRKGGILVQCDAHDNVPIVRTTTEYPAGPLAFSNLHLTIVEEIRKALHAPHLEFNNAMIEMYNQQYRKMKFHSDQALDLVDGSLICVYSCYKNPATTKYKRILIVKHKQTNQVTRYSMDHNSIIVFSTKANQEHVHRIVLETDPSSRPRPRSQGQDQDDDGADEVGGDNSEWIGITFRLSKTYITVDRAQEQEQKQDTPFIAARFRDSGQVLRLTTEDVEKKEFRKLKGNENMQVAFVYPELDYTLSASDLMPARKLVAAASAAVAL